MAAEGTPKHASIPRFPGDIMIYPMLLGLLLHTFVPDALEMGGFTTAAVHGGNALVFVILFGIGVGIDFRSTPKAVKCGLMILIPKLALSIAFGLFVAFFLGDDFFGLSSLAIIGGVSFCNIALYTGIMAEYGDDAERGAAGILCFTVGPTITMVALGAAGIADISLGSLVGSLLPIVLGIVLGNLFPYVRQLMAPGVNPCIVVLGFALGCGMSLGSLVAGGLSGILLAVICLVIGVATSAFDRLTGGTGKAGMACSTIAGTAMTTPPALAASDASYAALVPVATAQIAAAVIVTALVAPLLTCWLDKRPSSRKA